MATVIKGICYNETSDMHNINSVHFQHSQLHTFWNETRHFTRLSSKVFDNVIYESLYGCSIPGMPDEMMGSRKRATIPQTGKEIKTRTTQKPEIIISEVNALVLIQKEESTVAVEINQSDKKKLDECGKQDINYVKFSRLANSKFDCNVNKVINSKMTNVEKKDFSKCKTESHDNSVPINTTNIHKKRSVRSNSVCGIYESLGRVPRNSNQIDITSTPLYKEIYANNLRQYGFLLAKKLGISNQSPRELRKTYLQSRRKADLWRARSNSSASDFSKRLSTPSSPIVNGRRLSMFELAVTHTHDTNTTDEESLSNTEESPIKETNDLSAKKNDLSVIKTSDSNRNKSMKTYLSRSCSDVSSNKYADSLTNISEIVHDKENHDNTEAPPVRTRVKQIKNIDVYQRYSAPVIESFPDAISVDDELPSETAKFDTASEKEPCHSATFSDREPSRKTPTTVLRRKHKNIRDPHKRLSAPLLETNIAYLNSPKHTRRTSLPAHISAPSLSSMSSLSVPDLYHQSNPGNEQLMDAYCKQDLPRRQLSINSLRRHNEAKHRLEWRISKLKSFEGILSEADSFMKDIKTMKETSQSIPE